MKNSPKAWAFPALALAVLFWGTAFPAAAYLVNRFSLWTIMLIRLIIASLVFLLVPGRLMTARYKRGDWLKLLIMTLSMPCLYFLFETTSLMYTSSVQSGVIAGSLPLFVTLGAALFLKEEVRLPQIGGLVLSMGGVVLLTLFNGGNTQAGPNPLLGNSLELLAMVCAAANLLIQKDLYIRYSPAFLTRLQSWGGIIFFLPGLARIGDLSLKSAGLTDWAVLIYLGAACSFGAYFLYNGAQSTIKASSASVSMNLIPVVALVFGRIFLGETLNTAQLISALAVLGGVFLSQINFPGLGKKKEQPEKLQNRA